MWLSNIGISCLLKLEGEKKKIASVGHYKFLDEKVFEGLAVMEYP